MTVYSSIRENKIRTWLIMAIFVIIISGFFYLIGQFFHSPKVYFFIGFVISLLSGVGSYYYSDRVVLAITGARKATKKEFFDYYTVAENLSLATGLPMPRLYVIDDPAPNAFATGRNAHHAVICATTGLLSKLERAEIEGVVGHELSHIKNNDILLASVVSVLVGTIALVSDWIMRSLWWGGGDSDRKENSSLYFFLIIALILAPIAATLIQLAIYRKREYLADASSALITRNPGGLARALEKISRSPFQLRHASNATAHLFIANPFRVNRGLGSWFVNLFSTHPPIEKRIALLRQM